MSRLGFFLGIFVRLLMTEVAGFGKVEPIAKKA